MLGAVGYVRVSAEEQAHGLSPDAQREIIEGELTRRGVNDYVIEEDLGVSAWKKSAQRPGFERAVAIACANRCPLVVTKVDRFGRLLDVGASAARRLEDVGASLVAVTDGIDTGTSHGKQIFGFMLVGAGAESQSRSDRLKTTSGARARRRGHYGGGRYRPAGRNDDWSIFEPEAAAIRRACDLVLGEGMSVSGAQRQLRAEGFVARSGNLWPRQTLRAILRNPQIAGLAVVKGERTGEPATFPPIISDSNFEALQRTIGSGVATSDEGKRKSTGREPIAGLLLRGLGRHDVCGIPIICRSPRRKGGRAKLYACALHEQDAALCPSGGWFNGDAVDGAFARYFADKVLDVEGSVANLEQAVSARLADTQTLRKQAAQQALAAQGHLDSLWRDYETAAEKPSLLFVEKRSTRRTSRPPAPRRHGFKDMRTRSGRTRCCRPSVMPPRG
jgi:DNA invertase Pin-like site-specific DNA recombinase